MGANDKVEATFHPAPEGWDTFGTNIDWVDAGGKLEFSAEVGEDFLPLWERRIE